MAVAMDYLFGGIICIYDASRGCIYLGFIYMGINIYLGFIYTYENISIYIWWVTYMGIGVF